MAECYAQDTPLSVATWFRSNPRQAPLGFTRPDPKDQGDEAKEHSSVPLMPEARTAPRTSREGKGLAQLLARRVPRPSRPPAGLLGATA